MDGKKLEEMLSLSLAENGWRITSLTNEPGFRTDENSPVPSIMTALCEEESGEEKEPFFMSGGTYSRYLPNAFGVGTALAVKGAKPSLSIPEGHGGIHQRDEKIVLDDFFRSVSVLLRALLAIDQTL